MKKAIPMQNIVSQNQLHFREHWQARCNHSSSYLCLANLVVAIAWLVLSPNARSQTCEQGCDINKGNTFLGNDALLNNTNGSGNTAVGDAALIDNTTGVFNTACGASVLDDTVTGSSNSGFGAGALEFNVGGNNNTAVGANALSLNDADNNTATGFAALQFNTTGTNNTADGYDALFNNSTGSNNVANGVNALLNNTTGSFNAVNGVGALKANTVGNNNTADGYRALFNNTSGSNNIAIGASAGSNLTTGSNNIDIGALGAAGEANTIRLGKKGTQTNTYIIGISGVTVAGGVGVMIDTNGHMGTVVSSERFKDDVKPMDRMSEAILGLQPVTFCYKKEFDPQAIPQFGLVAEQVEKVDPDLVARDDRGKPYSVRYEAVNAMLLNEFLKAHRELEAQKTIIVSQQEEIETLTQACKKQAAQIQTISAQLDGSAAPTRMAANTYN